METYSNILSWRIPWTEEPERLQSMGHKESNMTELLSMQRRGKMRLSLGNAFKPLTVL